MLMKEVRHLLQNSFKNSGITQSDIMAYRGGYSKSDRRIIEQKMFSGQPELLWQPTLWNWALICLIWMSSLLVDFLC